MALGSSTLTRECGRRKFGKIYVITKLVAGGAPLERFLIDPVRLIPSLTALGMSAQGIAVLPAHDRPGVFDLYDWVGAEYENMWDYLEEGRRHGFSALVPITADFSKITKDSRRIPVFPRAALNNSWAYTDDRRGKCPTGNRACEDQGGALCVELPREATTGGERTGDRTVIRKLKSGVQYSAWESPANVTPDWIAGIGCWLPLTGWEVIRDSAAPSTHEKAMKLLEQAKTGLPLSLEDA